jgi:hypothetical protein
VVLYEPFISRGKKVPRWKVKQICSTLFDQVGESATQEGQTNLQQKDGSDNILAQRPGKTRGDMVTNANLWKRGKSVY